VVVAVAGGAEQAADKKKPCFAQIPVGLSGGRVLEMA